MTNEVWCTSLQAWELILLIAVGFESSQLCLSFFSILFFFSCCPPLFLIVGRVSQAHTFTSHKMLLTCSSAGILIKAGLRKACAKAFVPCLNGSTHLPPFTTGSQKGG